LIEPALDARWQLLRELRGLTNASAPLRSQAGFARSIVFLINLVIVHYITGPIRCVLRAVKSSGRQAALVYAVPTSGADGWKNCPHTGLTVEKLLTRGADG
jgi:hypothetical protein